MFLLYVTNEWISFVILYNKILQHSGAQQNTECWQCAAADDDDDEAFNIQHWKCINYIHGQNERINSTATYCGTIFIGNCMFVLKFNIFKKKACLPGQPQKLDQGEGKQTFY